MDKDQDKNQEDQEEDKSLQKYSNTKYFGKISKEIKLFYGKVSRNIKIPNIKKLKITLQTSKPKQKDSIKEKMQIKIDCTPDLNDLTSNFKFQLDPFAKQFGYNFSSSYKKNMQNGKYSTSCKVNEKKQLTGKIQRSYKTMEDRLKINFKLDGQWKKDYRGVGISFIGEWKKDRQNLQEKYSFLNSWKQLIGSSCNMKYRKNWKQEIWYKTNITTINHHKLYYDYHLKYEKTQPIENSMKLNFREKTNITTFNTQIKYKGLKLISKEVSFLLDFKKNFKIGFQRKNQSNQLICEVKKIQTLGLKSLKVGVGSKGVMGTVQSKIKWLGNMNAIFSGQWKAKNKQFRGGLELFYNL